MKTGIDNKAERSIYYRLIALWVLNEAMLGGIIHGLKIPVSGLIVGSCAVICICLIGWYVPKKGAIIRATVIVAIFKMMLSPQAPPPAYAAVFFQGLLGELLFWNRRFFTLSCLLLAVLALLESGLQRILMLTIIYGNDLWKAINDFINGLTRQKNAANYSLLIGSVYVFIHLVAGLFTGWVASVLPQRIEKWSTGTGNRIFLTSDTRLALPVRAKKRKRLKKGLLLIWILLILLYVQSYYKIGTPLLPSHISFRILLRSLIIVLTWIFVVSPLLRELLHFWLQKKKTHSQEDIRQVLQLLPAIQTLITAGWRKSAGKKGWKRIAACTRIILVNALKPALQPKIFILSGAIQSGKTTSIIQWSENRPGVFGILSPVVNGRRMFMDAHLRHLFDMEADEEEMTTPGARLLKVGRFTFSQANFDKAVTVLRDAKDRDGWLVIDEIGPLELKGEGFAGILREIIAAHNEKLKLVLVIREGMTEKVKEFFELKDAVTINNIADIM